jgi:hypothetical protein
MSYYRGYYPTPAALRCSPCVPIKKGPTGPTGPAGPLTMGNVLRVDAVYGNDATASVGGSPYKTVNSAVAAASSGQTVWILPGTYTLSAGITIPTGVSIRGLSTQTVTLQMVNVTSDTTLVTMGENTRLEDCTLLLTSSGHYTLVGIRFGGTTTVTAKLRTAVVSVNNATALGGTSNVYGVLCDGVGVLSEATFSFNCLKGSTINVYSNGGGAKRGIIVTGTNIATTRDLNVYVAQPTDTSSAGSYIGVETDDPSNLGSIQMRSTTSGVVKPTGSQAYTASDIRQTTPPIVVNPSYLANPGIQIGPGSDLVTKSAGGKGFSSYTYPTTIYYGLKGNIISAPTNGYLWPGTQAVAAGSFPDPGTPPAYYRMQQPSILCGMNATVSVGPGGTNTTKLTVYRTPVGGSLTITLYTVTFTGTDLSKSYYDTTIDLAAGELIHLKVEYTGTPLTHDLTCQLDLF